MVVLLVSTLVTLGKQFELHFISCKMVVIIFKYLGGEELNDVIKKDLVQCQVYKNHS